MRENKLIEAIDNLDEKYINEAEQYRKKVRKLPKAWMGVTAMAACFLLVCGIGLAKFDEKADSVVCIDVNPSIEITVNKKDKVLGATAINEDAKLILADMDLADVELNVALNAIMGSLYKNGYLDDAYNAVNVCVENNDTARASRLGEIISLEINNILDEKDVIGKVSTQFCVNDKEAKQAASEYGISVGKYMLAQQVVTNMEMPMEVASQLSIEELWDLLEAGEVELLTKEEALQIAVTAAGVELAMLTDSSQKVQETAGVVTYIVTFGVSPNKEYEYKINATNGTIITSEVRYLLKEEKPGTTATPTVTPTRMPEIPDKGTPPVQPTAAPTQMPEATPTAVPTKEPKPEATPTAVPTKEPKPEATPTAVPTKEPKPTKTPLPEPEKPNKEYTKKEALVVVYGDAGIQEKDAKLTKLQHMPKEKQYHIEFSVGLCDYVYDISSVDGSIVSKEVTDHTVVDGTGGLEQETVLTEDVALNLALAKAGVSFSQLTKCEVKYNAKKDGKEYKIHFHVDKDHYEYIVDAVTGAITEKATPGPATPEKPVPPHEKEETGKVTPAGPKK